VTPVHGVIAVEEQPTTDGRLVQRQALYWKTPIPVMGMHPFTKVIGHIDEIARHGNYLLATGEVDDPRPVIPCGVDITDMDVMPDYDTTIPVEPPLMVFRRGRIHAVTTYIQVNELPAWPGVALLAR
jgi:hypothetical protein